MSMITLLPLILLMLSMPLFPNSNLSLHALKDLGDLSFFLGIQATRDSNGLHLHQGKYVTYLLRQSDPLLDPTKYRHIVGALQYCMLTRPDIVYSVNQLCQFLYSPTSVHMTAAKCALRYLKGTLHYGLYYTPSSLKLNVFSDFDWAGSPDDKKIHNWLCDLLMSLFDLLGCQEATYCCSVKHVS